MGYKKGQTRLPAVLALALFAGLLVTVVIAMIIASLISAQTLALDAANIGSVVAILFGAATASLVASVKMGKLRLPMCFAGAGGYFLGLLCCAAILFDGVKSGVGVTAIVVAGGALCICLLGLKGEKRPKYKVPKIRI